MLIIIVLVAVLAYLLGSCPYGLILVKLLKNKDIRKIGSNNIGATNVLRAGYPILAIITLVCDILKGVLAVFIALLISKDYGYNTIIISSVAAIFSVLGHIFPVWLKFQGGKGVATTLGTILYLNVFLGLSTILIWLLTAILTKYSSLSAIIALICLPILSLIIKPELFITTFIISIVVLYKHKDNFIRLINNNEDKIKIFKKKLNKYK